MKLFKPYHVTMLPCTLDNSPNICYFRKYRRNKTVVHIPDCSISQCTKTHQVDFCGECNDFPCEKAENFLKGITLSEWHNNNEKIREYGIEEYYKYAVSRSHYQAWHQSI